MESIYKLREHRYRLSGSLSHLSEIDRFHFLLQRNFTNLRFTARKGMEILQRSQQYKWAKPCRPPLYHFGNSLMGGLMACEKQSNLNHCMSEKNSLLASLEPHGGRQTPNQGRACLLRVQDEEKEM